MTTLDLAEKIRAYLFWIGEPVEIREFAHIFNSSDAEVSEAISHLLEKTKNEGNIVIKTDSTVQLATNPELSKFFDDRSREEREKELSKSSVETLSIIAYRGPISRSEIDYIRGVNSNFILRSLLIRGLIEKVTTEGQGRSVTYQITPEFLSHLGLSQREDLPEFEQLSQIIQDIKEPKETKSEADVQGEL